jgi:molybdopterin converting factor small subunit
MTASVETVTVKVLLFASYADWIGRDTVEVSLPAPATVSDLVRQLREEFPQADRLPTRPLSAINAVHATVDSPLREGDEVALLPPLAGG